MKPTKEIKALFKLIDDPDMEVYDAISEKLMHFGKDIIPNLESLWEHTSDESVQERIETLIHRVHFQDLQTEFLEWSQEKRPELMRGALLVAKYQYPELDIPSVLNQLDQIRRNIWLELNNYLTPLEQVNVFNSILYSYYKLQGHELTEREPKFFFINQVLDSKQGNSYTLGVLYLVLCELLDVPVFAMNVPRQFILAYIDTLHHFFAPDAEGVEQLQFFLDPLSGMVYTQLDVNTYLKKINAEDTATYFTPLTNKEIIYKMMEELAACFQFNKEPAKAEEIYQLMELLKPEDEEDT